MPDSLTSITGVNRVIKVMQELHAGLAGVESAPLSVEDYPAGSINTADMPMVVTKPGEADHYTSGMGSRNQLSIRQYIVQCLFAHTDHGIGREMEFKANNLLYTLPRLYTARENQEIWKAADGSATMRIIRDELRGLRDTGMLNNVFYSDDPHVGFELFVWVEYRDNC